MVYTNSTSTSYRGYGQVMVGQDDDTRFLKVSLITYNWLFMWPNSLCVLAQKRQFKMYVDFIYAWLYMRCGYPYHRYKLCKLYLYDFSFTRIIV